MQMRETSRGPDKKLGDNNNQDQSCYGALVTMAQDFNMNSPLVHGQGNFGSIDGDNAAAMRYTEAKLTPTAELMLKDIDKNTVPFVPNYDETETEPFVLPGIFPNLMVNGSTGIAVGMATSIPPHNPKAMYEALDKMISNELKGEESDMDELINIIKAPDFPTGANMLHNDNIKEIYTTGRGRVILQSKYEIEDENTIVITEIPYRMNKPLAITKVHELSRESKDKKTGVITKASLPEVKEIRDESTRDIRVVIELKTGANPHKVIQKIFKKTDFQSSFSANMVALLADGTGRKRPCTFTLKEYMTNFIVHTMQVVKLRTEFDLTKAQNRKEVIDGILKCLADIDAVIKTIKDSKTHSEVVTNLMQAHDLTERQATSIADMKLRSVSQASAADYEKEGNELQAKIMDYQAILATPVTLLMQVRSEFNTIKKQFSDERKTEIIHSKFDTANLTDADFIDHEDVVITLTKKGQIKSVPVKYFNTTGRGSKGVKNGNVKEDDYVRFLERINTRDKLLFFTNRGECHFLWAYEIPIQSKNQAAKFIYQYLDLAEGEEIIRMSYLYADETKETVPYLMMATRNGIIKKLATTQLKTPHKKVRVMSFETGDELAAIEFIYDDTDIMMFTRQGQGLRTDANLIRPSGRAAKGVRGIKLKKDNDAVISMTSVGANELLMLTEAGYGKRINPEQILTKGRGGQGVRVFGIKEQTGQLSSVITVNKDDEEIILATRKGQIQRQKIDKIRVMGNNATGVRVVTLNKGDRLVSASAV